MSSQQTPQEWRNLLRNSYPDEIEEVPGRRERRRAKKAYNRTKRQAAHDRVREEREKEPVTAGAVLLILLLLLGTGLVFWLTRGNEEQARPDKAPAETVSPSRPPTPSASPSPEADSSDADVVADAWARAYFTRDPYTDHTRQAVVERASRWMTPQLTTNLAESDDPAWGKLVSHGGTSKVTDVKVTTAGAGLPVDTPLRVWRKLTVTYKVHGYDNYTGTRTVRAELSRAGDQWQVSRALGA